MSSMLEQAIIDAQALREAALKSAQSEVIEKYSEEIKDAVSALLQEQDEMGLDEEMPGDLGGEPPELQPDMPLAATDGEKLCPCPEEEDEIEIDFSELTRRMQDEGPGEPGEMMSAEEEAEEMPMMESEVNIDYEQLEEIIEELTVDMEPARTGYAVAPQVQQDHADEQTVAALQDTSRKEEFEALRDAVADLEKVNESLKQELESVKSSLQEQKTHTETFKNKLVEVNNLNGKLFYQNKALNADSLNERQKEKFVEALSKAETVEEAKVIFETLQSAVGSNGKRKPQSLSEVLEKPSMTSLPRRRNSAKPTNDLVTNRWKALAGIKD